MTSIPTTSYTSPFESGEWGRMSNLERLQWLRYFQHQIKQSEVQISKQFKLDNAKMMRLAEAVAILESVCKDEFALLEKRAAYNQAMHDLAMDELLKSPTFENKSFPAIVPFKRKSSGDN